MVKKKYQHKNIKTKMKSEIKDTIEFIGINMGGVVLSLSSLDAILRTSILLATLTYSIIKIYKLQNKKHE
jgi:aminoglycoside N3'-acetyltransferase